MPFKGDMRLGGRHSNVATLNGTASDFVSVPANGTVLSGPTDTSRNENDFLGTPFYMPYSTTVYADGLGGQTSVETWGLQYLPAGWVTATTQFPQYLSWNYTCGYEPLSTSGAFEWGYQIVNYIEDGTGINSPSLISTTTTATEGMILDSSTNGTGADRYRVLFNSGEGGLTSFEDFTMHPVYDTNLGGGGDGINSITTPCSTFNAGGWHTPDEFADGYGGSYSDGSDYDNYDTYPAGSYLEQCNGSFYYSAAAGGVYTGHPPYGWPMNTSGSNYVDWQSPDYPAAGSTSGQFAYDTWACSGIADGTGNTINESCSGTPMAYSGDPIASGSYYYEHDTGSMDDDGNNITERHNVTWSYTYNGNGGYNVASDDSHA